MAEDAFKAGWDACIRWMSNRPQGSLVLSVTAKQEAWSIYASCKVDASISGLEPVQNHKEG